MEQALADGLLIFDPQIEPQQIGPTGIDLRLGPQFTVFKKAKGVRLSIAKGIGDIAEAELWKTHDLEEYDQFGKRSSFSLEPGEFVLGRTLERVSIPANFVASVEGRSSYARLGISVHQTAPWIHPGFNNHITLEMRNSGQFTLDLTPTIDKPCQLTVFTLTSPLPDEKLYKGQFQKQIGPFRIKK